MQCFLSLISLTNQTHNHCTSKTVAHYNYLIQTEEFRNEESIRNLRLSSFIIFLVFFPLIRLRFFLILHLLSASTSCLSYLSTSPHSLPPLIHLPPLFASLLFTSPSYRFISLLHLITFLIYIPLSIFFSYSPLIHQSLLSTPRLIHPLASIFLSPPPICF